MGFKENLLGLAGQVLAGQYEGRSEDYLRTQVMRLYRGAEFAPPAGVTLGLLEVGVADRVLAAREIAPGEVLAEAPLPVGSPLVKGEPVPVGQLGPGLDVEDLPRAAARRGRRKEQ